MNLKHLLNIESLGRNEIEDILNMAKLIEKNPDKFKNDLDNKVLAILFFQPSTRTRIGFSVAMQKLGGNVVSLFETKKEKNMSEGESLEDTIKIIGDYSDVICLRHYSENSTNIAIKTINKPIINCGNGNGQHPTQTLIDLYTIKKEFNRLDNLKISIIGDLKNMRSAHSLIIGLSLFQGNKIKLVAPDCLKMPKNYLDKIKNSNFKLSNSKYFEINDEDIIYMAGMPITPRINSKKRNSYQMNASRAAKMKKGSIIMNPLPRIDEIAKDVDESTHAKYFQQSANGLFVRMAILKLIFS